MDIYDAAGYNDDDFTKVVAIVTDLVGTGSTLEEIVRKGAETLDRDSYVAGLLIGISMERQRAVNE